MTNRNRKVKNPLSHPECGGPLVEYVCLLGGVAMLLLAIGFPGGLGESMAGQFTTAGTEINGEDPGDPMGDPMGDPLPHGNGCPAYPLMQKCQIKF